MSFSCNIEVEESAIPDLLRWAHERMVSGRDSIIDYTGVPEEVAENEYQR